MATLTYEPGGVFPVQQSEELNTKDNEDYWRAMDNILDTHESFGHLERGETPPKFLEYELPMQLLIPRYH